LKQPVERWVNRAGAVAGLLAQLQAPDRIIGRRTHQDVEDVQDHHRDPEAFGVHLERLALPDLQFMDFDIAWRVVSPYGWRAVLLAASRT